jgi:O-antigen ligase
MLDAVLPRQIKHGTDFEAYQLSTRTVRRSLTMTLLCPGADPLVEGRAFGFAVAALIMAGEFTFRARSASLALSGSADSQILVEIFVSAVVGGWLIARRLMGQFAARNSLVPYRRLDRRSPLRVLRFIAAFAVVSSFWSTTAIAPVRAIQLVIVVELLADAAMSVAGDTPALRALFRALATSMFIGVVAAAVITVGPGFTPFYPTYNGPSRLRLLAMHPIATADLLAFVALLLAAPLWRLDTLRAWSLRATRSRRARAIGVALLATTMVFTLERGSTSAGLLALGVLLLLNVPWYRFRLVLLALASAALGVAVVIGSVITSVASRGQTSSGITSLSGRNQIFDLATHLFWARPYAGWGYNAGRSIFLPTIPWAGESHNVIVEIAVSSGIVGLVAYTWLFSLWHRQAAFALATPGAPREVASLSVALVVLIAVVGIGSDSFAGPPKLLVISLALAMMLSDAAVAIATTHGDERQSQLIPPSESSSGEPHARAGNLG